MNKLNLDLLIDVDHLTEDQEKDLKILVSYTITPDGSKFLLTFTGIIDTGFLMESPRLSLREYKLIMYHVMSIKGRKIADLNSISDIINLLKRKPHPEDNNWMVTRFVPVGDKEIEVRNDLEAKAQDLYKIILIIKKLGLV